MQINILYQDEHILAADKPAGVLSAPDRWDPDLPVAAAILSRGLGRLWPVHRLDKDTTGVLLLARSEEAHRALSLTFQTGSMSKVYHALVCGAPGWTETFCDLPLSPDSDPKHRTTVDTHRGKPSLTRFLVLRAFDGCTLVEARTETGRTHQVRVHLATLGFPVVCDPLYGDGKPLLLSRIKRGWKGDPFEERPLLARTALHAASVEFPHPATGESVFFAAPYPRDFRAALTQMERWER
ncbi:MAG TPA: RluA family pseudouridine synthase [Magnetospirillaceae bacterium]|nr:RluA family pseudouridine synthase [Magnetospirillaceae bacterium]